MIKIAVDKAVVNN